ncbi:lipocalin-like domain-containing protein [Thiobaca trueperi]|uniref:Putative secreted hydrolase n=1 Tax=Thiobaca trueperi TaxID=127458 RepID=A0A4R3MZU7_9GAMM|nr:lipocalin-like domain-containing protein [Thiobaca trueperi]TCT21995.1 putative secreted hydrolase [Thiobaca trueperi]
MIRPTRHVLNRWAGLALALLLIVSAQAADFAPVLEGRQPVFPEDTGAHPDYRTEWWYITGWLTDDAGIERGFQVTFFRVGTGIGADNPSRFAPRQLILAHAAIADPVTGHLIHAERAERALEPLSGAATGHTHAWIGDWDLMLEDETYRTRIDADDFALDLTLTPAGPPVLNGRNGFSQKTPAPANASHYYSRPQLAVQGRLRLADAERTVNGRAWLDHEWSSEILPETAQGWDWIGINLHDGGSLMAFQMRQRDGSPLWAGGTFRQANGRIRILTPAQVRFNPLRRWQSPRTGADYPVEWEIEIDGRRFALRPLMDDQELDGRRSTGAVYWEGASRLIEDEIEIGRGYLEMTGYWQRQTGL